MNNYVKYINNYINESISKNEDIPLITPQVYENNGTFFNAQYRCNYDICLISPLCIRFSQNNIHLYFDKSRTEALRNSKNKTLIYENTVYRTLKYLRENIEKYQVLKTVKTQKVVRMTIPFIPINVIKVYLDEKKEKYVLVTLDNRRLYVQQYIARLYYPEYLVLIPVHIQEVEYKNLNPINTIKFGKNKTGTQNVSIQSSDKTTSSNSRSKKDVKVYENWIWYRNPFKEAAYPD